MSPLRRTRQRACRKTPPGKAIGEKAVNLHPFEDVLEWVAVLIGTVVMHFTYPLIIDPILSNLITLITFSRI